ncbi:VRR-NUC domain-containing protein [Abortiporus biennis]|nr:VRR-NUC domain-containing protein [Abortiporus biennis]
MVLGSPVAGLVNKLVFWAGTSEEKKDDESVVGTEEGAFTENNDGDRRSMYIILFEEMVATVLQYELYLLSDSEIRCIRKFNTLSESARYLLVRLCLRKRDKWHRLDSLKYQRELRNSIPDAVQELCYSQTIATETVHIKKEPEIIDLTVDSDDEEQPQPSESQQPPINDVTASNAEHDYSVFADDASRAQLRELMECLTLEELRRMAKDMKLKATFNRVTLINTILSSSSSQTTLNFPKISHLSTRGMKGNSTLCQTQLSSSRCSTQQERLREMVMKILKQCIRISEDVMKLFLRLNLIYFRSTAHSSQLLTSAILSQSNKRTYPSYEHTRTSNIWPTRTSLLAYEEALEIESRVDSLFDGVGSVSSRAKSRSRSVASKTPAPTHMPPGALSTPRRNWNSSPSRKRRKLNNEEDVDGEYDPRLDDSHEFGDPPAEVVEESPRVQAAREVKAILEAIFPQWQEYLDVKDEDIDRPKSLQRFDCGHVLTRVVCRGSYALGILKEYDEELRVLDALLCQKRWRRGRRGKWHERKALILMTHMGKSEEISRKALEAVIEALKDDDTHIVYRPSLVRRLTCLENRLKIPVDERHICQGQLAKCEEIHIEGVRVQHRATSLKLDKTLRVVNSPSKSSFLQTQTQTQRQPTLLLFTQPMTQSQVPTLTQMQTQKVSLEGMSSKATGKTIWYGRNNEEITVEEFALEHYEDLGFKGFHCEGRIVTTLFGLLFWDIIFAPIAGAFETPYQTAPLDIADDTFFTSREELIERRLAELRGDDENPDISGDGGERKGKVVELLDQIYDEHSDKQTWCVGVRWDLFPKDDLIGIAKCIKGNGLAAICQLLCEDYSGRTAGVPDLIVWNSETGEAKFVEVKGPGDTLQENQKVWIDVLLQAGVRVEVCRVDEQGKGTKKSSKATRGTGRPTPVSPSTSRTSTRKRTRARATFKTESEDEDDNVDQLDESEYERQPTVKAEARDHGFAIPSLPGPSANTTLRTPTRKTISETFDRGSITSPHI